MIEFNLVPKNLRFRSRRSINWLRVGFIGAVALTVLVVSVSILNGLSVRMYEDELAQQLLSIAGVETAERQLRDVRRENERLADEIRRLESLGDEGDTERLLHFLGALSAATGDEIWLQLFDYTRGGGVVLAGVGSDAAAVSAFFERVREIDGVRDAALTQLRRASDDDGSLRSFELQLQWQAGG